MKHHRFLLVALVIHAMPQPACAQSAADLVEQGVRAYRELDFDAATDFLLQALASDSQGGMAASERVRALSHLGAIGVYRGSVDSAAVFFRRLVLFDPRYRIDQLTLPPEVSDVFERVRNRTPVVTVEFPGEAEIAVGTEQWSAWLVASSPHDVTAEILRGNAGLLTRVYNGPIGDSIEIQWDPRDAAGQPVASGRYFLAVTSRDSARRVSRRIRVPLEVEILVRDTLPHPLEPSDYLPERKPPRPRAEALAGGILAAAAVFLLPPVLAPESDLTEARFGVAGALTVAGLLGFLLPPPGPPIPENVADNQRIRRAWESRVQAIVQENARRRADVRVFIRAGAPTIIDSENQ